VRVRTSAALEVLWATHSGNIVMTYYGHEVLYASFRCPGHLQWTNALQMSRTSQRSYSKVTCTYVSSFSQYTFLNLGL